MKRIVLDIETIPIPIEEFSEQDQAYLLKVADDMPIEVQEHKRQELIERLAFGPLTCEIVAIGLYNPDTQEGRVLLRNDRDEIEESQRVELETAGFCGEMMGYKAMLEKFWAYVASYEQIVTFNGRGFDCPVIIAQSAMEGVKASCVLMGNRYNTLPQLDLMDQMAFFGSTRKYSLDFWCRQLGIPSPKSDIDGNKIKELYDMGVLGAIGDYCAGDCLATASLLKIFQDYYVVPNPRRA